MLYNEIHKTLLLVTNKLPRALSTTNLKNIYITIVKIVLYIVTVFIEDGTVWSVSYVDLRHCRFQKNVMKSYFSSGDLANEVKKVVDDLNNEFGDNYQDNGKFSIS